AGCLPGSPAPPAGRLHVREWPQGWNASPRLPGQAARCLHLSGESPAIRYSLSTVHEFQKAVSRSSPVHFPATASTATISAHRGRCVMNRWRLKGPANKRRLTFDRHVETIAPLRPGAVVVGEVIESHQIEHKHAVCRADTSL